MTTANAASVTSQMRDKAIEIKDNVVELAGIVTDGARSTCADATQAAGARYQAGVARVGAARDRAIGVIQDHPVKSMVACVFAGALAGFFIARRR